MVGGGASEFSDTYWAIELAEELVGVALLHWLNEQFYVTRSRCSSFTKWISGFFHSMNAGSSAICSAASSLRAANEKVVG